MASSEKKEEVLLCKIRVPKYNRTQLEHRFVYFLSLVLKNYYEKGIISHSSSEYKALLNCRKRLHIPGKSFELIDLELKPKYPNLPDWVFKRYTKAEMLKDCQDYIDRVNVITE